MKNNSKIKKAVFVYTKNKEFLYKFESITQAGKELNINYYVIKKYAKINLAYKCYISSYEKLRDELIYC